MNFRSKTWSFWTLEAFRYLYAEEVAGSFTKIAAPYLIGKCYEVKSKSFEVKRMFCEVKYKIYEINSRTLIHVAKTSCHRLVRTDARHGDSVGWNSVRKSSLEGSLSCNIGRFHLLDDGASANILDNVGIDASFSQKSNKSFSLQIMWLQVL